MCGPRMLWGRVRRISECRARADRRGASIRRARFGFEAEREERADLRMSRLEDEPRQEEVEMVGSVGV
jgi:hypothetical protein